MFSWIVGVQGFRKCYSKMKVLIRKGYKPKNVFVHFYNLHLWPLGLILMYPGSNAIPSDRIEENMMKKNLKRKHGSSTSGTDSTTASDSEA